MVFYFLAVKPWVDDVTKVACIKIRVTGSGDGQHNNVPKGLEDVISLTCLMNRPAIPIESISFKERGPSSNKNHSGSESSGLAPISADETLGETLARIKKEKELKRRRRQSSSRANPSGTKTSGGTRRASSTLSAGHKNNNQTKQQDIDSDAPPVHREETLGETLARMKKGEWLDDSLQRRGASASHNLNKRNKTKQQTRRRRRRGSTKTTDRASTAASIALSPIDDDHDEDEDEEEEEVPSSSVRSSSSGGSSSSSSSSKSNLGLKLKGLKGKIFAASHKNKRRDFEMEFDPTAFFGTLKEEDELEEGSELTLGSVQEESETAAETIQEEEEEEEEEKPAEDNKITTQQQLKPLKSCLKVKSQRESMHACRGSDLPKNTPSSRSDKKKKNKAAACRMGPISAATRESSCSNSDVTVSDDGESQQQQLEEKLLAGVRWGPVHLREHAICLGDNPACSSGAPLSLDWSYNQIQPINLDFLENFRRPHRRTDSQQLKTTAAYRQEMLLEFGYNTQQLTLAIKAKEQDQKKRIETVARLKYMKFDEKMEKMMATRIFPISATHKNKPSSSCNKIDFPSAPAPSSVTAA